MTGFNLKRATPDPKMARMQANGRAELKRLQRLNKAKILQQMRAMDPILFEFLVGAVFEGKGYTATGTIASGDEGVDLVVRKGLTKAVVQCKRYSGSVGQPVVRDLYGTMLHNQAKESYLVTTAMITSQARAWSKGKPIHLIDGYKLVEWIVEAKTTSRRRRYGIFVAVLLVMVVLFNAYLYWPIAILDRSVNGFMNAVTGAVAQMFSGGPANLGNSPIAPYTATPPPPATTTPVPPADGPSQPINLPPQPPEFARYYFPIVTQHTR